MANLMFLLILRVCVNAEKLMRVWNDIVWFVHLVQLTGTVAGSLACFVAIFCSSYLLTERADVGLGCGLVGMAFELVPLKDMDNLVIPIVIASFCHFYFHI